MMRTDICGTHSGEGLPPRDAQVPFVLMAERLQARGS